MARRFVTQEVRAMLWRQVEADTADEAIVLVQNGEAKSEEIVDILESIDEYNVVKEL